MTAFNMTITRDRSVGVASSDSFIAPRVGADVDSRSTHDMAAAMRSTFTGNGQPRNVAQIGSMSKILVVPHLRLLASVTGAPVPFIEFFNTLVGTPVGIDDVRDVAGRAQTILRNISARVPGDLTVGLLGWVQEGRRVAGFAFIGREGFEKIELDLGHTLSPPPDPGDAAYDALYGAWGPAIDGQGTEAFHELLLANQIRASRNGKLAPGGAIDGVCTIARVDAAGITLRTVQAG